MVACRNTLHSLEGLSRGKQKLTFVWLIFIEFLYLDLKFPFVHAGEKISPEFMS